MSWTNIDDRILSHPKMKKAVKVKGDAAWAMWSRGLVYTNAYDLDGRIPADVIEELTSDRKPFDVANLLVRVGLWEKMESGDYRVHDFAEHNDLRVERDARRKASRDRLKKHRDKRAGLVHETPRPVDEAPPCDDDETRFTPVADANQKRVTKSVIPSHTTPSHTTPEEEGLPPTAATDPGCGMVTYTPVATQTSNPDAAKILQRILSHDILRPIASVRHAERMAKWTMASKKLDWLLASVDELSRYATSRDGAGQPLDAVALTDKLETFAGRSAAPRPGATPGDGAGGHGDPAPARRGPSAGDIEAMRDAFPERFNDDGSLRSAL